MRKILIPILLFLSACSSDPEPKAVFLEYRGMDLSFQPEIELESTQYFDEDGNPVELLNFIQNKGINLVRLRLWHTPSDEHSSLEEVIAYSKRVKARGMKILLDFHYSDTWADPGSQDKPAAWENLDFNTLKDSIYEYTFEILTAFNEEGVLPDMVQIGNETNSGFLWDDGKVINNSFVAYGILTRSAVQAVRDLDPEIEIMLHFAGPEGSSWFFDNMRDQNVDYDIMGLSYYSIWHGKDLNTVKSSLEQLVSDHQKPVMMVETGYPWTLEWNDWTNNFYGLEEQLIPSIPATPAGQVQFMQELRSILGSLANEQGIGFCYWAPDWVAYRGPEATDGSVWENLAVFDFQNKALPVMDEFGESN